MFLSVYCEDSEACHARGIVELEVEACSKAISALCHWHGKSPCFSRCHHSSVISVDWRVLVLAFADGGFFLD